MVADSNRIPLHGRRPRSRATFAYVRRRRGRTGRFRGHPGPVVGNPSIVGDVLAVPGRGRVVLRRVPDAGGPVGDRDDGTGRTLSTDRRDRCSAHVPVPSLNTGAKAPPSRSRTRIEDSRDPKNRRFSDDTAVREADKERSRVGIQRTQERSSCAAHQKRAAFLRTSPEIGDFWCRGESKILRPLEISDSKMRTRRFSSR